MLLEFYFILLFFFLFFDGHKAMDYKPSCVLENILKLGFGKETYLYLKESLLCYKWCMGFE